MAVPPDAWNWKLVIRVPAFIGKRDLSDAAKDALSKGKSPNFDDVVLETIREGLCVQMLHVGSYATEAEDIAKMCDFANANGCVFHGIHHELYFSDPRHVPEEKLKTLLRIPVKKK